MIEKLKQLIPVVGLVTGVFYGVLRLAYVQFYLHYGIAPEEVGIDKTDLLSQALVGPIVLVCLIMIYLLVLLLLMVLGSMTYINLFREFFGWMQRVRKQRGQKSRQSPEPFRWEEVVKRSVPVLKSATRVTRNLAYVAFPASFVAMCVMLYASAVDAGEKGLEGEAVSHQTISLGVDLPLLEVRSIPTEVSWKTEESPRYFSEGGYRTRCLLYLGENATTTILFNLYHQEIVRVPSSDAVFGLQTKGSLPETCTPRH
jgi:hypothetical protein